MIPPDVTVAGAAIIVLAIGLVVVGFLIDRDRTAEDNAFRYGLAVPAWPRTGVIARADRVLADTASERDWAHLTGQPATRPVAVYEMPHDDRALD